MWDVRIDSVQSKCSHTTFSVLDSSSLCSVEVHSEQDGKDASGNLRVQIGLAPWILGVAWRVLLEQKRP